MKKILIADDEQDILQVIKFRLVKMGYEVAVALNGQEALDLVKTFKPDLILLDYAMPILNGDEVCKQVKAKEETKHIPVIIMTATAQKITEEHLRSINANDSILKPFDQQEFLDKIEKYLKKKDK